MTFRIKTLSLAVLLFTGLCASSQQNNAARSIADMLELNQQQTLSLAEAFSEKQLSWRPDEGIRSAGEALMHVAATNYYLAMRLGFTPPEGVDIMAMENISGKDAILEAYGKSAAFVREKLLEVDPASLLEIVDLGFTKENRLSVMMRVLQHNGEHKGQLIAYARSNGITPPWSRQE